MKVSFEFNNGDVTEVEVSEEIGAMIIDSRREEENRDKMEHRHCYSLDAITYEGAEYGTADFVKEMFDGDEERAARVRKAFSHLSEIQRKRLLLLSRGLSIREIARREGKDFRTVHESIEAGRKKFLKFF